MKSYRISKVTDDYYAAEYTTRAWEENGIEYEQAGKRASDIYLAFEGLVNTQAIEMPNIEELRKELINLERRISRSGTGQNVITHPRNAHDDYANAVAGCAWLLNQEKPHTVRETIKDRRTGKVLFYKYFLPSKLFVYWSLRPTGCSDFAAVLHDGQSNPERIFASLEDFERFLRDTYVIDVKPPDCETYNYYFFEKPEEFMKR